MSEIPEETTDEELRGALSDIISPTQRRKVYAYFQLWGTLLGAAQVGFLVVGEQPVWLSVALAVTTFLGVPLFGSLAKANVR